MWKCRIQIQDKLLACTEIKNDFYIKYKDSAEKFGEKYTFKEKARHDSIDYW